MKEVIFIIRKEVGGMIVNNYDIRHDSAQRF